MTALLYVAFAALAWAACSALHRAVLTLLREHRITALNYENRPVPRGTGLFLYLLLLAGYACATWLGDIGALPERVDAHSLGPLTAACGLVFFAGWFDDTAGDSRSKGFGGHLRALVIERRLSSGMLKAILVFAASGWLALIHTDKGAAYGMVSAIVICLTANLVNLLDLRPGRAIKGFLLLACPMALAGAGTGGWAALCLLAAGALIALPEDLKAAAMLGDSGANLLGFAAGYALIRFDSWPATALALAALVALHVVAERSSFSRLIERHSVLRWLDRLGRDH